MSLFMVEKESIRSLTGKSRVKDQIIWLREHGYVFHVNQKGPVIVLRDGQPFKHEYQEPPKGLLNPSEIIKRATSVKPVCGVYFLITGSRIMYVGKSSRVLDRITEHVRKGSIPFEAFYFIEVPKARLSAVEDAYIKAFNPPANKAGRLALG